MFGQTSTENSKENKLYFVNALNDSSSKIGPDFRNKVCQKLILTKNVLLAKLTSNLLFSIEKKNQKNLDENHPIIYFESQILALFDKLSLIAIIFFES